MKKIRLKVETYLVKFGVWLLPKLSRSQFLLLCQGVGLAGYAIDYRGRATALENLRVAFAPEGITPAQARRIALGCYQNFARTFLDLFWVAGQSDPVQVTKKLVTWHAEDPGTVAHAHAHGSLWLTLHFGNFELLSLIVGTFGFSFVTIAQNFKNADLTAIFARLRQCTGHHIIPKEGAMLRFVKELKRGGHASLLTDLTVKPGRTATVVTCFGLKTCTTNLHTTLGSRLGLPLIPALCIPRDDGTYLSLVTPPLHAPDHPTPEAMAQAIWDRFEPVIRENPECWMWMYKHWRYLPGTAEDTRYPAYANPSRPFREMLAPAPAGG